MPNSLPLSSNRLTGWNAIQSRTEQLGLQLTDDQVSSQLSMPHQLPRFQTGSDLPFLIQVKDVTAKIKELADTSPQTMDDVGALLRVYHSGIQSGDLVVGQKENFALLLERHHVRERGQEVMGSTPVAIVASVRRQQKEKYLARLT